VLVLVDGLGHPFEVAGFVELGGCLAVDGEVAEGSGVVRAAGESGFGQVVVVRGSEKEDPLPVLWKVVRTACYVLIASTDTVRMLL